MTLEEAWATGIIEGEGYFVIHKQKYAGQIGIRMTDLDVLQRIQKLWGGKIYDVKSKQSEAHPEWKRAYVWLISKKKDIYKILETMMPMLQSRRAYKAQNLLDRLDKC